MTVRNIAVLEEHGRSISAQAFQEAQEKLAGNETLCMLFKEGEHEMAEVIMSSADWEPVQSYVNLGVYYDLRLLAVKDLQ